MGYWKYRAFDAERKTQEGVLIGPDKDEVQAADHIILQLRQRGLQVVHIQSISQVEYQRDEYLQRLKRRLSP